RVIAERPQGSVRETNFAALDRDARLRSRLCDVSRSDRAEKLALGTRLGRDDELKFPESPGALLCGSEVLPSRLFQLNAPCLKSRHIIRRRERRLALREQVVAAEAGPHFHTVADVAEIGDFLQKNDFHGSAPQCWSV